MDNVNNSKADSKPENSTFQAELDRMLEQIKAVREIERRTDIWEDKNNGDIKDDLKKINDALSKLNSKGEASQDASTPSTTANQSKEGRACNKHSNRCWFNSICCWLTFIGVLAVFSINASWLFRMAKDCNAEPQNSIPYIAGGVLILLLLSLIIIVLARQSKFIMGCKDKVEDE